MIQSASDVQLCGRPVGRTLSHGISLSIAFTRPSPIPTVALVGFRCPARPRHLDGDLATGGPPLDSDLGQHPRPRAGGTSAGRGSGGGQQGVAGVPSRFVATPSLRSGCTSKLGGGPRSSNLDLVTLTDVRNIHAMALGPALVSHRPSAPPSGSDQAASASTTSIRSLVGSSLRRGRRFRPSCRLPGSTGQRTEQRRPSDGPPRRHPHESSSESTRSATATVAVRRLALQPRARAHRIRARDRLPTWSATRYLRALRRADSGYPAPLGELLARQCSTTSIASCSQPSPARFGSFRSPRSPRSNFRQSARSRVAANRGRLRAQKGDDGRWRSTRSWVDDYAATRHQRRG